VRTTFHVLNSNDDIVGSINIPPEEEAALLKHWTGSADQQQQPALKIPPLMGSFPRQMVLRGC
jgi:hypothetical protein